MPRSHEVDDQFGTHRAHPKETLESASTFFVDLSRAGQRTIFTSCNQRGNRVKIADLYAILAQAGVEEHIGADK
jgi:hypothetical protein